MPAGKGRLFGNLLLVAVATVIAILVFEIALRVIEPESNVRLLRRAHTATGSYLALKPGVHGLVLGRPVSVNSAGYRGALLPQHKSPGVTRILFFGDSHTFSIGADDAHSYPALVEHELVAGGCRCEVLNFGVPGQDLRQMLDLLHDRAFDYDPDLIVMTFHSGDILESPSDMVPQERSPGGGRLGWMYHLKVELLRDSYVARLVIPYGAALLREALDWRSGVTFAEQRELSRHGRVWQALSARILALRDELRHRGIRLAFVLFPSMLPFDEHPARGEYALLEDWLVARGIPTLNLLPAYRGRRASALTASLLDKHPNEKAYAIASGAVAPFLAGVLRIAPDVPRAGDASTAPGG